MNFNDIAGDCLVLGFQTGVLFILISLFVNLTWQIFTFFKIKNEYKSEEIKLTWVLPFWLAILFFPWLMGFFIGLLVLPFYFYPEISYSVFVPFFTQNTKIFLLLIFLTYYIIILITNCQIKVFTNKRIIIRHIKVWDWVLEILVTNRDIFYKDIRSFKFHDSGIYLYLINGETADLRFNPNKKTCNKIRAILNMEEKI